MKHLIEKVLEEYADAEVNLKSSAARKMVASGITAILKTRDDLGVDEYPYPSDFGDKIRETEKSKWVCEHCGKSTFEVDWDYIGTNYNHLSCDYEKEQESYPYNIEFGDGRTKKEMDKMQDDLLRTGHDHGKVWHKDAGDGHMLKTDPIDYAIHNNQYMDKVQAQSPYNDGWTREYYQDKLSEQIVDENKSWGYIFESPDGGKTVYKRKVGESKRELVSKKFWDEYTRNRNI